jgi:hypothetical protein
LYEKNYLLNFLTQALFVVGLPCQEKSTFLKKLLWHVWDKGERNMKR